MGNRPSAFTPVHLSIYARCGLVGGIGEYKMPKERTDRASFGPEMKGNTKNLLAMHAEGQRRMNRRKRRTSPGKTRYDREFLSARCNWCDTIFAGPHKGEKVKLNSPEYYRIKQENFQKGQANTPKSGGITDLICNKRSCIDESTHQTFIALQEEYPDHDFREAMARNLEEDYQERRTNTELYPEGLIDDVEPPL